MTMTEERPNGHQMVRRAATEGFASGWENSAAAPALAGDEAGTVSAVAREEAELKAAIVVARRFPRDEANCYAKIIKSCERPSFAEGSVYSFPRGGQQISGPSVDLAREMARCWGNVRYGLRLVTVDDDYVHIKGYTIDLETNNLVEAEDKFKKLVFRKGKGWIEPDERDLRELVNRRGAILVRNCILQVMPPDVTEDAVRKSRDTMERAARGELKQNKQDAIRRLVIAFDTLGVNTVMLAERLGHPLDLITEQELADLRSVYKSINDGNSRREDHFKVSHPPEGNGSASASSIQDRLRQNAPQSPPPPVTNRPVSEGQAFEPNPDEQDRKIKEQAAAVPPLLNWEAAKLALIDAAQDVNMPEGEMWKRVHLWLLASGAVGSEDKKTTPASRRQLVDAVRNGQLNEEGDILS